MTLSFRDPSGGIARLGDRTIRIINQAGIVDFETALESPILQEFVRKGRLSRVFELDEAEINAVKGELESRYALSRSEISKVVEHETIEFPSYPYEWTAEMLYSAAKLTLELSKSLLAEGMGLKDATPYNVLFKGPTPVFVDWLSFEKREQRDPTWLPQAQFVRTFILPLIVSKYLGWELSEALTTNRDGLEPEKVSRMLSGIRKLRSPFFSTVTLPKILARGTFARNEIYKEKRSESPEKARFILEHQFRHLEKLTEKAGPAATRTSEWSEYLGPDQHFTREYLEHKADLVSAWLEELQPKKLLDIGCNTGYFSRIAANHGALVLAIDRDPVSVGNVWTLANKDGLDILPLVVDITRPTPAIGWQNRENYSFLERVRGRFDTVLMLAVIHHMLVSERIPLGEIFKLLTTITTDALIIEFVPPQDKMFQRISRGRDQLFEYLDESFFQKQAETEFRVVRSEKLADSERRLYLLQK